MTASTRVDGQAPIALVLGARGRFGAAAVQAFAQAGWTVLAQARRPLAELPPGARALSLALNDTAALVRAARGAKVVVYAVNPLYTRWDAELLPLARQGMAVAQQLGARFLLPGNVYNFGHQMPAVLNESCDERPSTRKGEQRCALEAELRQRADHGLRSLVIRAGDFYGAGTGSWLDLVIAKDLRRGRLVYPGPLDRPHAWAYLPDLAQAFVAAAGREDLPPFMRWHFTGHTLTGAEFLQALKQAAEGLGLQPGHGWRQAHFPWWLIRLAGLVWPMGRELTPMAYLWEVPHALDGRALATALGPLPSTPPAQALMQALRDLSLGGSAPARWQPQG